MHGVVTDESGAIDSGRQGHGVQCRGPGEIRHRRQRRQLFGRPALRPGKYTVQASSPGFQQVKPAAVDLSGVTRPPRRICNCSVAAEKQEVTVQENAGPASQRRSVPKRRRPGAARSRFAGAIGRSGRSASRFASAGRTLRRTQRRPDLHRRIYRRRRCRAKMPSARSASTRIRFRPNTTSSATDASRSSPSPAPTSCTETSSPISATPSWDARNPYAAEKAPFLQRNFGGSLSGALGKKASFFLDVQDRDIDNGNIINGYNVGPAPAFTAALLQQRLLSAAKSFPHQPAHRLSAQHEQHADRPLRLHPQQSAGPGRGKSQSFIHRRLSQSGYRPYQLQIIETAVLSTKSDQRDALPALSHPK